MPQYTQAEFEQHLRELAADALREQGVPEEDITERIAKMVARMKTAPVDQEPWKDFFPDAI